MNRRKFIQLALLCAGALVFKISPSKNLDETFDDMRVTAHTKSAVSPYRLDFYRDGKIAKSFEMSAEANKCYEETFFGPRYLKNLNFRFNIERTNELIFGPLTPITRLELPKPSINLFVEYV